jgi:hypothetical protein
MVEALSETAKEKLVQSCWDEHLQCYIDYGLVASLMTIYTDLVGTYKNEDFLANPKECYDKELAYADEEGVIEIVECIIKERELEV